MTTSGGDDYQQLEETGDDSSETIEEIKKRKFWVVSAIISTEFGERLAYYGLAGSLTLFCRRILGQSAATASELVQAWIAYLYITPVVGGYIADSKLGRYRTILYFVIFYLCGLLGVSICSFIYEAGSNKKKDLLLVDIMFYLSLFVIGTGTGGVKSCVAPFGAQQVAKSSEIISKLEAKKNRRKETAEMDAKDEQTSFFNWFYFGINLGAVISFTLVAYLCQNVSFSVGYSIPTIALFISILVYILPSKYYYHTAPNNSALGMFFSIVIDAIKNRANYSKYNIEADVNDSASFRPIKIRESIELTSLNDNLIAAQEAEAKAKASTQTDDMDIEANDSTNTTNTTNKYRIPLIATHWLDMSKKDFGGSYDSSNYKFIDDCKYVFDLTGFLFFFIFYWCVYNQQSSVFFNQGCQMNYYIGNWEFPISSMSLADSLIILILVPIMDKIIYPYFEKKLNIGFPLLQRIGTGYFFASLAMFMAAFIEIIRKNSELSDVESTCDDKIYIRNISIFWQMPQYILVGTSEVLASIAGLEFFYDQAPKSMQTIVYSLFLVTTGFGSLAGTIIILIVNETWKPSWINNNLDEGYLEYYFILLGSLMTLCLFGFIWYSERYTYKLDDTMGTSVDNLRKYSQSDRGRPRTCCKIVSCRR